MLPNEILCTDGQLPMRQPLSLGPSVLSKTHIHAIFRISRSRGTAMPNGRAMFGNQLSMFSVPPRMTVFGLLLVCICL